MGDFLKANVAALFGGRTAEFLSTKNRNISANILSPHVLVSADRKMAVICKVRKERI